MRVGKLVQWKVFGALIHGAITREVKGPGGRPRFHPILMFKVLVLGHLHGLADDATSFQITDRNIFRAFLGLTPGDAVPDGQIISDFRQLLIATKTFESLFDTAPTQAHLLRQRSPPRTWSHGSTNRSAAEIDSRRLPEG